MKFSELTNKKWFQILIKFIIFSVLSYTMLNSFIRAGSTWYTKLVMYTNLSNFIVWIEYLFLLVLLILNVTLKQRYIEAIRLTCNIPLIVTFLVFGLILTPLSLITKENNPFTLDSLFKHFICPILMILDYFIVDRKIDKLEKIDFFYPLFLSIAYLTFVLIRGFLSDYPSKRTGGPSAKFPYFFLDPYYMGYWFEGGDLNIHFGIFPSIIVLALFLLLITYLTCKIRNPKKKSKNQIDY